MAEPCADDTGCDASFRSRCPSIDYRLANFGVAGEALAGKISAQVAESLARLTSELPLAEQRRLQLSLERTLEPQRL